VGDIEELSIGIEIESDRLDVNTFKKTRMASRTFIIV